MATLTYAHVPGDTVYHVGEDAGVRKGIIKTVDVEIRIGVETIMYSVAMSDPRDGVIDAPESDLFADVDAALAYYKTTYVI